MSSQKKISTSNPSTSSAPRPSTSTPIPTYGEVKTVLSTKIANVTRAQSESEAVKILFDIRLKEVLKEMKKRTAGLMYQCSREAATCDDAVWTELKAQIRQIIEDSVITEVQYRRTNSGKRKFEQRMKARKEELTAMLELVKCSEEGKEHRREEKEDEEGAEEVYPDEQRTILAFRGMRDELKNTVTKYDSLRAASLVG